MAVRDAPQPEIETRAAARRDPSENDAGHGTATGWVLCSGWRKAGKSRGRKGSRLIDYWELNKFRFISEILCVERLDLVYGPGQVSLD